MRLLTANQFNEKVLAPCQAGDTAFHGMLYPGVYPGEFDQDLHQTILGNKQPHLEGAFFDLCRELVSRQVRLEWLRVLPAQSLGYSELAVLAERQAAIELAKVTGADMRITDYDVANEMLSQAGLGSDPLTVQYRQGATERSPKSSFWRLDTPLQVAAKVSIMHYNGNEFDGHMVTEAPTDEEDLRYTDFWKELYDNHARPVAAP